MTDPDARTFTHWVLYNLPANATSLPANVPKQDQLSDGSRQGRNDFGKIGYGGSLPAARLNPPLLLRSFCARLHSGSARRRHPRAD